MKVVHVIDHDKFTVGYINFMKQYIFQHEHYFIVCSKIPLALQNQKGVFYVDSYQIPLSPSLWQLLNECDAVIFSGIFNTIYLLKQFPAHVLRKTYLQFWGGDFYNYRWSPSPVHIRYYWDKFMRKLLYQKSAGHLFLIAGEDKEYEKIFGHFTRNYIVPVPGDNDSSAREILSLRQNAKLHANTHILVGNSASKSNGHKEVLDCLYNYRNKKIKVFIPLSYGDEQYSAAVIRYAKEKLGDAAIPITHYMSQKNYLKFLSYMDIGILNCNRQQAMGNIICLLGLGKKVYIRRDTTMWDRYCKEGYTVYDTSQIATTDFNQFINFPKSSQISNEEIFDQTYTGKDLAQKWNAFLDQIHPANNY